MGVITGHLRAARIVVASLALLFAFAVGHGPIGHLTAPAGHASVFAAESRPPWI